MKVLLLADIHANAEALKAVLKSPEACACGEVISLGDQVNYGPQPEETLDLLLRFAAQGRKMTLLMGNHEERLDHIGEERFRAYNWSLLRWTASRLGNRKTYDVREIRRAPFFFTHGIPGNPSFLMDEESVKDVLDALPEGFRCLVTGHDHAAGNTLWHGKERFNPGSLGMNEGEGGGTAPFAVLDQDDPVQLLRRHAVCYDANRMKAVYRASGAVREAPEMTRLCLNLMLHGRKREMLAFMAHVQATAEAAHASFGDESVWREADRTWPANEGVESAAFWKD